MTREEHPDGRTTVTQTVTVTETITKPTYPQEWPAYNAAQTHEKDKFLSLLHDLCSGIPEPPPTRGRPRIPLADALFAACFKVYSTFSGRRFMSDLRDAQSKEYLRVVPHYNSIFRTLEDPHLTPILRGLIIESSLPLKTVEADFAVDSSGFTTSRFIRWFDHKYGVERQQHEWVKVHLMCGVKTSVVTAIEIREKDASDTKLLPDLVKTTGAHFDMREVSADKGYSSVNNVNVIAAHGATPYIAFKSIHSGAAGGLWEKMFHYFAFNRQEFMAHYHKRSNVESTFSMIKAKFPDHVRSKTDVAMTNEVLCKILCHNICCVIQAMYELGIQPASGSSRQMNESHPFMTPLTSEYEPDRDASLDSGIAKTVKILRGDVTMPDPYTRFKTLLNQCLEMLGAGSLHWPLHWVAMAPNGIILKGIYTDADDRHPEYADQGEHSPEKFMAFPMHYLFVDSTGKGTHIVVRSFSSIELVGCG